MLYEDKSYQQILYGTFQLVPNMAALRNLHFVSVKCK